MKALTTVRLTNHFSELERLTQVLVQYGKAHHIPRNILDAMNLALEELITNIISYAYSGHEKHTIILRLSMEGRQLIAEVEDDGKPFNPLDVTDPDIESSLEDRPIGGWGILLTKKMVDHIEYSQHDGKNLVRLKKSVPQ